MTPTMTPMNMEPGSTIRATGGLSEKRVISYCTRFFGVPIDQVRIQPLTPDASTRSYYRVASSLEPENTYIISLYPSPFNPHDNSFLDITDLFVGAELPVPQIIDVAGTEGVILQEDLGDMSLTEWLREANESGEHGAAEHMLQQAIGLIARIQNATQLAYDRNSVACRLAFDEDKLGWELNYFFDHFFGSYLEKNLHEKDAAAIKQDLQSIAAELSARPRELTHRDYHGMNLMVDHRGGLRIIDHQDARMGPATYDLVPLLVERRLAPADDQWLDEQHEYYLSARAAAGLPSIAKEDLQYEFNLMTLQRQLKAIGTFSYQTAVVGRGVAYEKYIRSAVATVLGAMAKPAMKEYPALRKALESV
jgi:aminoglycoside/choline kinase family phosphotransferase